MDGNGGTSPIIARLNKVFHRFADPNAGSRESAISTFLATLKNHGIDLRDLEIVRAGAVSPTGPDFQGLRDAFKSIRIPEVAELERLRETIDGQKITLAGTKETLKQAKATERALERQIKKLGKDVDKHKAKLAQAPRETALVRRLRTALTELAPGPIKGMTASDFEVAARETYGPRYAEVLRDDLHVTIKPGAKKIPTWLKVMVWTKTAKSD